MRYIAKFDKKVMSWVCYNKSMDSIHSAWVNREDAILMASDLNKYLMKISKTK